MQVSLTQLHYEQVVATGTEINYEIDDADDALVRQFAVRVEFGEPVFQALASVSATVEAIGDLVTATEAPFADTILAQDVRIRWA